MFASPRELTPPIHALARALEPYDIAAVCGPLIGGALVAHRVALELAVGFSHAERVDPAPGTGLFRARDRLPESLARLLCGKRVALVDDVLSAGSSLRATHDALLRARTLPVVVGALLTFGTRGRDHFVAAGLPVESVAQAPGETWAPADCPMCHAGLPLDDPTMPR